MSDMKSPVAPIIECGSSELFAELRLLYDDLDKDVAALGPVCQLSGRCCRFQEYGHTLFVSSLEVQYLLHQAPKPERALDQGATCPWQDARNRCEARGARPLGCRVYFCDPAYQNSGEELSERFIARLKRLTEKHGVPWNYAPLHRHLHQERERGVFPIDLATDGSPPTR
jgi:Fe-S-cluster containining protein